jgi:hypothetical protein
LVLISHDRTCLYNKSPLLYSERSNIFNIEHTSLETTAEIIYMIYSKCNSLNSSNQKDNLNIPIEE